MRIPVLIALLSALSLSSGAYAQSPGGGDGGCAAGIAGIVESLAYPGCNCFSGAVPFGEMLVAINPVCAEIVGREMPKIEDVQECLWKFASVDADLLQSLHRDQLERQGRIRENGRIYLTPEPKDMLVFVRGGLGGLHTTGFHSFGTSLAQTRPIASPILAHQAVQA